LRHIFAVLAGFFQQRDSVGQFGCALGELITLLAQLGKPLINLYKLSVHAAI